MDSPYLKKFYPTRTKNKPYIKVEIEYASDTEVRFRYPFSAYFMNEKLAPEAEKVYREFSRNAKDKDFHVEVRVKDGKALIEGLYIQDKPIETFLKNQETRN